MILIRIPKSISPPQSGGELDPKGKNGTDREKSLVRAIFDEIMKKYFNWRLYRV
jgi:hypothetical protein